MPERVERLSLGDIHLRDYLLWMIALGLILKRLAFTLILQKKVNASKSTFPNCHLFS